MSWGELFDRADDSEATVEEVRASLARRRAENAETDDETDDESDGGER